MPVALMVVVFLCLAVFLIAVVAKIIKIKSMPLHVRWEVYPVAHEPGEKAEYGGSYMEEMDWWKKPRESSVFNELREMIPEILFLVALKKHNKKLWISSFPFHFGLYILTAGAAFILAGAIYQAVTGTVIEPGMSSMLGTLLYWSAIAFWAGGIALSTAGALGLLIRRLTDRDLKPYTSTSHIINLVLFLVVYAIAGAHIAVYDVEPLLGELRGAIQGVITLQTGGEMAVPLFIHVASLFVLMAYIPLTHMSHFVAKYFLYHDIRWDDAPNLKGGAFEKPIQDLLDQKVTWAADHIKGEGQKSWLDLAIENPTKEEK